MLTRRTFLAGAGGGALALAVEGFLLGPSRLAVTRHTLGQPTDRSAPLRLSVLADLHLRAIDDLEEEVAAEVGAWDPDVILVVGDAVDRDDALPALEAFLGLLPSRALTVATLGNWEHWAGVDRTALAALYERSGGVLLVDASVQVRHGGRIATLVGVDDLVGGSPDLVRARAGIEDLGEALLLSHCPAFRERAAEDPVGFAAMISGHTHGGQIALGRFAPFCPPGSGPYVSGWYRGAGPDLYVSRGIGTSAIPVRLGAAPEVAHLEWFLGGQPPGTVPSSTVPGRNGLVPSATSTIHAPTSDRRTTEKAP